MLLRIYPTPVRGCVRLWCAETSINILITHRRCCRRGRSRLELSIDGPVVEYERTYIDVSPWAVKQIVGSDTVDRGSSGERAGSGMPLGPGRARSPALPGPSPLACSARAGHTRPLGPARTPWSHPGPRRSRPATECRVLPAPSS